MWDELEEPLGFVSGGASALAVREKRPTGGAAIGIVIFAIAVSLVMLPRRDLPKGEPFAVAKVEVLPAPRKLKASDATASVSQTRATLTGSAAQVETTSGVKILRGVVGPAKPLIIDVAQALGVKLAPTPDTHLLEKSKYGTAPSAQSNGTLSP